MQNVRRSLFRSMSLPLLTNLNNYRRSDLTVNISTSSLHHTKYYDALGIPASATQNDIKAAYYKLSMLYHPDKNKGSEIAAQKFRDITEAYEVLGNYKTRRLYDKGIIHTAGPQYAQAAKDFDVESPPEDDAQTKFYKAHMKKSAVPHAEGRTPIYNFDEWSRSHYGTSFERKKTAKQRFDRQTERRIGKTLGLKGDVILLSIAIVGIAAIAVLLEEQTHDVDRIKPKDKS